MKPPVEACCIVCQLVFCCGECRWTHEKATHGLKYDCPICRGQKFICKPEKLNTDFISHLQFEHAPLYCKKCSRVFKTMEDFSNIETCSSISELINKDTEENSAIIKEFDNRFDSIFDKVHNNISIANNDGDNIEGIISVNKCSKTAVITPIVRKKKIVDYECSDSEDDSKRSIITPYMIKSKTPKLQRQRAVTPHAKKLLGLKWQKVVEEFEETIDKELNGSAASEKTPSRIENKPELEDEMTTPTSHLPNLLKLVKTVTTSTPTHPTSGGWTIFPDQGSDSPLSEIENPESPSQRNDNDPSKSVSENILPKLKSIITTNSKLRLGSQDSAEKHVTFQDSVNSEGSIKKKVKFADDTIFEQNKAKRVYRRPKRMLTPGPQRHRFCYNPRFQALINRFENQGMIMARTPTNNREKPQETTPFFGEANPPRAINFKEDSPVVENDSIDSYKTCTDSPDADMNNAISSLTSNIAGSLQHCLSSVFKSVDDETEIQFKFVITKRKVSVKRLIDNGETVDEKHSEVENLKANNNIWSTVAKAVKNVFWGDKGTYETTPQTSTSLDSSSASKRKYDEISEYSSPLNHKRHKYEGRIKCRPPLRRYCEKVASLKTSLSEESAMKGMLEQDGTMNLSF